MDRRTCMFMTWGFSWVHWEVNSLLLKWDLIIFKNYILLKLFNFPRFYCTYVYAKYKPKLILWNLVFAFNFHTEIKSWGTPSHMPLYIFQGIPNMIHPTKYFPGLLLKIIECISYFFQQIQIYSSIYHD